MQNMDNVFKKVNLLKNIYWFVLFLSIVFGLFFGLITPSIKEYRVKNLDLKDSVEKVLNTQKEYDTYKKEMTKIKDENRNMLIAFQNKFTEDNVLNIVKSKIKDMEIVKTKTDSSDSEFIKHEYTLTGTINSPSKFYDLLNSINKAENIIELDFPIEFSKDETKITNQFIIRVYELKSAKKF